MGGPDFWPRLEAHLHLWWGRLSVVSFQTMLLVHALLIASACWLVVARRRTGVALAGASTGLWALLWFPVNQRWEGRTLLRFSPTHGVTESDLVVPVVVALALAGRAARLRWRGRTT